jgi:hypothetical protein
VANKTCSRVCSSKRTGVVDWDKFDVIDLVENKKMSKVDIGEMIGCSDSAVHKRYKKLKAKN